MKHIKWDFTWKAWVDLGVGAEAKFNFSEYGHAAYQIKGNDACVNMVAKILPTDPIPGP